MHTAILAFSAPSCLYVYSCILNFFADVLNSDLDAGMVLNEEKRARLVDALARRQGAPGAAGASAPRTPTSAVTAPSPTSSALRTGYRLTMRVCSVS